MARLSPDNFRQWFTFEQASQYLFQKNDTDLLLECLQNNILKKQYRLTNKSTGTSIYPAIAEELELFYFNSIHPLPPLSKNSFTDNDYIEVMLCAPEGIYDVEQSIYKNAFTVSDFVSREYDVYLTIQNATAYYRKEKNSTLTLAELKRYLKKHKNTSDKIFRITHTEYDRYFQNDVRRDAEDALLSDRGLTDSFGFTRDRLDTFIKSQTEPTPEPPEPKEITTRERGTYQNIIKALLYELKERDVDEKAFASIITTNSELIGAPVPQSTVYAKLNEVK